MTGSILGTFRIPEQVGRPEPSDGPPVGFLDTIGPGFRTAVDEEGMVQQSRLEQAYMDLERSLIETGVDPKGWRVRRATPDYVLGDGTGAAPTEYDGRDRDKQYAAMLAARARNPKLFAKLPKTREEYEMLVLRRFGGRDADQKVLSRTATVGGHIGNFVGFAGGSLVYDPVQLATLPIGGFSATIGRTMLKQGLIGMTAEAVQTPDMIAARKRMGEDTSTKQILYGIGAAGVGSAVLSGGMQAGGRGVTKIFDKAVNLKEARTARIFERLPEAEQKKWLEKGRLDEEDLDLVPDDALADIAEIHWGVDGLTPDEKAAIAVLRSDDLTAKQNPFVPNPAGVAAHNMALKDAMDAILRDIPSGPRRTIAPMAMPSRIEARPVSRPSLSTGTAISSGVTDTGGRATLKRRIGRAENASGSNTARPIHQGQVMSSALGRYQFLAGTWNRLYKRRFGAQGMSDAQIAALRTNGNLQEILMDDLVAANAKALRAGGHGESAGNLYLAHFAGSDGAVKVLNAAPDTRIDAILSAKAMKANRFIKGFQDFTAADLVRWAHRKMGDAEPDVSGASRVQVREELVPDEVGYRQNIQTELDRIEGRLAALNREGADGGDGLALPDMEPVRPTIADDLLPDEVTGIEPVRFDEVDEIDALARSEDLGDGPPPVAVETATITPPANPVLDLLPAIKQAVDNGERLTPHRLAKRLDAAEEDIRSALNMLAARDPKLFVTRSGAVRRVERQGPMDMLKFIARKGGIRDDEGHALATMFEVPARASSIAKAKAKGSKVMPTDTAFIPGAGKIVRQKGMSIDDVGELLHEAGYWHGAERPTVAEVLDMLDRSFRGGEKFFRMDDMDRLPQSQRTGDSAGRAAIDDEQLQYVSRDVEDAAQDYGVALSPDEVDAVARLAITEGKDAAEALDVFAARQINDALEDIRFEGGKVDDDLIGEWGNESTAYLDGPPIGRFEDGDLGPQFDAGDASQGRAFDGAGRGDYEGEADPFAGIDAPPDPRWDDGIGQGAQEQLDSMEHDLFGGPTRDDVRQALERQMEGRMKGGAQKAPGSDGGLFDVPDSTRSLIDEWADLEDEAAAIKIIKDCL